ncbi:MULTISPECIES: SCO family protein [Flectobacillus]|uniref:SCO family protein n=1 Tax=Flectobacillus roseus TaxID=502259 RepID=A0ABT6Y9P9_9BACT|nr:MULTISPECIES: SCO family protein [Flectobacillus]MDI9860313.1 SCO family protein [Flectobacillus roseus]MDI9871280.1 SCO family protein [Flectobacillus roseus]NBA74428.1 redoxin domain-containing protein [Emticicia sp. ODNR4P]PAC32680.1 SCO family protein [Flectobacillus sp. BAB-3569]
MQKGIKAGILIVALAVPALIFLFLRGFGENHYKLPKLIPVIDSTTGYIKMKKNPNPKWDEPEMDTVFHTIPDWTLTNEEGKSFTNKQLAGKIYVADFFFTRCTSICPKMSTQLTRVQDTFGQDKDVEFASFTVDPSHDTPEMLREYAKQYDAIPGKWHFLTGTRQQLYPLAVKGYYIPVADASEYDKAVKTPDETFIHSEKLILVDKEGYIRGFYDGTDKKDVDRLMLEIKVLQKIYETEK